MRSSIALIFLVVTIMAFLGGVNSLGTVPGHKSRSWPDLVGKDAEEAKSTIEAEDGQLKVQIVPERAFVTMDYRIERVRIYVNKERKVVKSPHVG